MPTCPDMQNSSKIYLKAAEGLNAKDEVEEAIEADLGEEIGEELKTILDTATEGAAQDLNNIIPADFIPNSSK